MPQNRIIYLGNMLHGKGGNPTTVDVLGQKLSTDYDMVLGSSMRNPMLRLLHMWYLILRYSRSSNVLLLDTYSTRAFTFATSCGRLSKWLRLPYIPILHGGDLPKRYVRSNKRSQRFVEGAWKLISPSGYLKSETEKRFNCQVNVISNPLDLSFLPFTKRSEIKTIALLWVRAIAEIYDPLMVVDIVKELVDRGHHVFCTMVGPEKDGSGTALKSRIKKEHLEGHFSITGALSRLQWVELSVKSNIFLNTTTVDNTPVSIMEAMALGFPVITSKVGGIPYLFQDVKEGIMVESRTANAFADEILKLYNNPEKVALLSVNARRKAETWDWEKTRLDWIDLLNDNQESKNV